MKELVQRYGRFRDAAVNAKKKYPVVILYKHRLSVPVTNCPFVCYSVT